MTNFYIELIEFAFAREGAIFFSGWIVAAITFVIAYIIVKQQAKRSEMDREYFRHRHEELETTLSEVVRGVTESLTKVSERFATLEMLLIQSLGRRNGTNGNS